MAHLLVASPEAIALHETAHNTALKGDFPAAYEQFQDARAELAQHSSGADTANQLSDIERDEGFTHARQAVRAVADEAARNEFSVAGAELHYALSETAPFVAGGQKIYTGEFKNSVSKHQTRELFSAHGATLGLLGRMVTARQVKFGEITPKGEVDSQVIQEQHHYSKAHLYLRTGNNQYFRTSNAMNGARQERINGRLAHAGPWLGRAATAVARAAGKDLVTAIRHRRHGYDFVPSLKTVARIGWSLRSRRAAIKAASTWNKI